MVAARRARRRRAGLGELRRGLGDRRGEAAEAAGRARASTRPTAGCPTSARSTGRATWSSPGTARPRACACRTATGSPADREGLAICDATSAAFAMELPWDKLDVVTWSWQKVLGGEAAHGMLALSPRAVERLESYTPPWPLPKIFRMTKGGKLNEGIFKGETINTPSMLCVEDALDGLRWAESVGGLPGLIARVARPIWRAIADWVARTPWVGFLAEDPATRSCTSICLKIVAPWFRRCRRRRRPRAAKKLAALLEKEGVAYDIAGLSRRAAGPAHLGRRHGRDRRHRGAAALARLGLRPGRGRARRRGEAAE